jgi:hypothetical protein
MEKEYIEQLILEGNSLNVISKITNKSLTTIRYWVKKYSLTSNYKNFKDNGIKDYGDYKHCPNCNNDLPISSFYDRRDKKGSSSYCKECCRIQILDRVRKLKQQMVSYKGGKCVRCGYSKYIGALEFHHIDPSKKDFTISHLKRYTFNKKVIDELDKCILVCANCHREIHNELNL